MKQVSGRSFIKVYTIMTTKVGSFYPIFSPRMDPLLDMLLTGCSNAGLLECRVSVYIRLVQYKDICHGYISLKTRLVI